MVVKVFIVVEIISILGELALVNFHIASIRWKSSQYLLINFNGGCLLSYQERVSPHHRLHLAVALLDEEGVEAAELDELAKVDIDVRTEHEQNL